ncbi:MAG: CRISPR-associated endonuclease Cas2 [Desulfovibrionaceae bacterium]|nr:CRISPR-associated endonuclease Cas2 [Desulfovibrionaceae bacterium]
MEDSFYLVIYDISDQKRLNRAANTILDYGIRIQKSVYQVRLNSKSLTALKNKLLNIIEPKEDGVKIFPLCESCAAKRSHVGAKLEEFPTIEPWLVI